MELEGAHFGTAAVSAICGVICTWLTTKKIAQKKARPVDSDDRYVTQLECKNCREAINKRIDELGPALNRIFKKLNENDIRSEDRAQRTHSRIDPLIEKLSETKGRVDTLENAISTALTAATKGGSK